MDFKVCLIITFVFRVGEFAQLFPEIQPTQVRSFEVEDNSSPLFRSLLVDSSHRYAYVGGKGAIYKLSLDFLSKTTQHDLDSIGQLKPNFGDRSTNKSWWASVDYFDSEFQSFPTINDFLTKYVGSYNIDTFKSLNLKNRLDDYLKDRPYDSITDLEGNSLMEMFEQYSTIYHSIGLTFQEHCERQADLLSIFYGNHLRMSVNNKDDLCSTQVRALTLMDNNKLFAIRTGMFGTMPVSATGTNHYAHWLKFQGEINPLIACLFDTTQSTCSPSHADYPPNVSNNYSGILTDPDSFSNINKLPGRDSFLMPSPENFLGKQRHCDNTPAPNRLILSSDDLSVISSDVLVGQNEKESCSTGALVQNLLGGYHPDQKTFSLFSTNGNGRNGDMRAVYLVTEIGQEKQQDVMLHYLNLPEIYPLGSSASLAIVRFLINSATGDVDPTSIVISNPFKYTWVTSPLNRFGRLDKTGSQEQVAYIPKAVGVHEEGDYVYFFFREADWENIPVPSHNLRRYHHRLNSYSHALYFPWEKSFVNRSYIKQEEEPGETFEELYAPTYMGWQHINDNMRVTGRVARVSKKDAGLPLGLTDANLFDLDHKLSLTTFQTFLKSRLTCRVPVAGVPFVWRLVRDTTRMGSNNSACFTEVRKAKNLYSKDMHYRSVGREEYVSVQGKVESSNILYPSEPIIKYFYLSHCKGYRWAYVPKPKTSSALYVEYTELRDFYFFEGTFYGVFSTSLADEQLHSFDSGANSRHIPNIASAICSFSMSDIEAVFNGPFKKRDKNTGNYRPYGEKDTSTIRPSPHSSEPDEVAQASVNSIKNMTINFLDPTQPYSEELKNIDLRRISSRVNFFEEDVYGTRTMWNDVRTNALLTQPGVLFEKLVALKANHSTILYAATNEGRVYKILNSPSKSNCKLTDSSAYRNWINKTKSMSSIWDNDVYAYLNRTVNKVTFTASFASDLTMEKDVNFPDDVLLRSDWDCTPSVTSSILAVLKPFGNTKTKIWDMKLAGEGSHSTLILVTDKQVLQISTTQCELYTHCTACIADPDCLWLNSTCKAVADSNEAKDENACMCQVTSIIANVAEDVVLSGLNQAIDLTKIQWYKDDVMLEHRRGRVMLGHDTSLILFNVTPSNSGEYQLKNIETNECLALYNVTLSDCEDEQCRYEKQYQEWCNDYDDFFAEMTRWRNDYSSYGYCRNLL